MLKGTLDDFTLPDVFRLMSLARKTGKLDVTRSAGRGTVFFREGDVYYAESSVAREPLGQKLIRAGHLKESQLMKALDEHAASGVRVGEVLVSMGAVNEEQLQRAVQEQIEDAVFDLLRWELGEFSWEADVIADVEVPIQVSGENLIMEASRKLDELEVIFRKIPSEDAVLTMAATPPEGAVEIRFTPEEWRLLVLVNGQRSVREIGEMVGLDDLSAMRAFYGLVSAGLVEVMDRGEVKEEAAAPAAEEPAAIDEPIADEVAAEEPSAPVEAVVEEPPAPAEIVAEEAPAEALGDDLGMMEPTAEELADEPVQVSDLDVLDVFEEPLAAAPETEETATEPEPYEVGFDPVAAAPDEPAQAPEAPGAPDAPDWATFTPEAFDAPGPQDLVTETPEPAADPFLDDLLTGSPAASPAPEPPPAMPPPAPERPVQAEPEPAAPEPEPAAEAPAEVDRAAVVRELAGLFDDDIEDHPRPARPQSARKEGTDGESDNRKRVEDDDQVTRGLISRLIDGVKGL